MSNKRKPVDFFDWLQIYDCITRYEFMQFDKEKQKEYRIEYELYLNKTKQ